MKTFRLLIVFIFTATSAFCQDFDQILMSKQVDCSDISYNSAVYFVKYMNENEIDSASYLLDYWESRCGVREPIFRARILLALKLGQFDESFFVDGDLNYIFNYQSRMDMIKYSNYYSYDYYKSYYGFIPPGQEFDRYTQKLAASLKNNYDPESMEYALAEFYGDDCDAIIQKLQTKTYQESSLAKEYYQIVQKYVNIPEFHMSWITGVWIPTGELTKIGIHPELGIQGGFKHKRMNYDLIMAFRFLKSPNYYYAMRDGQPELTDKFFGGHIGLDVGWDLYAKKGHEIQITGGIALDGFDVLNEDKDKGLKSVSIWSYDFSIGVGYRYYITNSFYIGLRAKYNVVDYTLKDIIDFTGNPVTIQFLIGTVNNPYRNGNLERLGYKLRK